MNLWLASVLADRCVPIFRPSHCAAALLLSVLALGASADAQPLHQRIDEQIAQAHVGPLSPVAGDADFVRRVHLDLVGSIPSAAQTRAFLADAATDKRAKLIDQLLASPRHAQHLANVFDVMLMERRADKHVPAAGWQKYLYDSFLTNKPYDFLVREILTSDGTDPATRPAAKFLLDRDAEPNLLTRDVGRIFFGRDFQCAQCHDHPLVDDYYQADYYGLYAFFSRTQLFTFPDGDKKTVLMDNAAGEVSFQSVFDPTAKGNTLPRVPGGRQVEEPWFAPGDEWAVAPAKDTRHVPKYIRRSQLAGQTAVATNRQFNRNIANRLWATMLGQGLVEPVDLHHAGNPPTHPLLLELLADELVAAKYDMRTLLREIALSQTYQRSLDLPADVAAQAGAASAAVPALEAEHVKLDGVAQQSSAAQAKAVADLAVARKAIPPVIDELTKAAAPVPDTQKAIETANKALAEATGQFTPKQETAKIVTEAATKAKEAAGKLPEEKDLGEAAAKFQAKSDQLNAEVATLAKVVEEKAIAVKTAGDQLVAINQALAEVNTRVDAVRKQVIALEEQQDLAASQGRSDKFQARLAKRRLEEAKSQAQYAAAIAAQQAAQAAAEKLAADLAAAKAIAAKLTADLPQLQAAQTAAQKAGDEAQTTLTAAKQAFEAKEAARSEFGQVLAKADAALQKLPQDAELAAATQKLKARSDQLTAETAEAQKAHIANDEAAKAAAAQLAAATQTLAAATAQMAALTQGIPALEPQVVPAQQKAAADAAAARQLAEEIPERWSRTLASRPLRQLSPEQFGWSVLEATGVYANYVAATSAEIEKATPLTDAAKADPAQLAARQRQIDEAVHTKLVPSVVVFVQLFGSGAGQPPDDFFATVDQALFLANGGVVKGWLAPSGDNLATRLLKLDDPRLLAEELYVSVLSRSPTEAEAAEVGKYLAARPTEKPAAVQELAWSLLSSAEFRFNH